MIAEAAVDALGVSMALYLLHATHTVQVGGPSHQRARGSRVPVPPGHVITCDTRAPWPPRNVCFGYVLAMFWLFLNHRWALTPPLRTSGRRRDAY